MAEENKPKLSAAEFVESTPDLLDNADVDPEPRYFPLKPRMKRFPIEATRARMKARKKGLRRYHRRMRVKRKRELASKTLRQRLADIDPEFPALAERYENRAARAQRRKLEKRHRYQAPVSKGKKLDLSDVVVQAARAFSGIAKGLGGVPAAQKAVAAAREHAGAVRAREHATKPPKVLKQAQRPRERVWRHPWRNKAWTILTLIDPQTAPWSRTDLVRLCVEMGIYTARYELGELFALGFLARTQGTGKHSMAWVTPAGLLWRQELIERYRTGKGAIGARVLLQRKTKLYGLAAYEAALSGVPGKQRPPEMIPAASVVAVLADLDQGYYGNPDRNDAKDADSLNNQF